MKRTSSEKIDLIILTGMSQTLICVDEGNLQNARPCAVSFILWFLKGFLNVYVHISIY